jgi:hypothetical protein
MDKTGPRIHKFNETIDNILVFISGEICHNLRLGERHSCHTSLLSGLSLNEFTCLPIEEAK